MDAKHTQYLHNAHCTFTHDKIIIIERLCVPKTEHMQYHITIFGSLFASRDYDHGWRHQAWNKKLILKLKVFKEKEQKLFIGKLGLWYKNYHHLPVRCSVLEDSGSNPRSDQMFVFNNLQILIVEFGYLFPNIKSIFISVAYCPVPWTRWRCVSIVREMLLFSLFHWKYLKTTFLSI